MKMYVIPEEYLSVKCPPLERRENCSFPPFQTGTIIYFGDDYSGYFWFMCTIVKLTLFSFVCVFCLKQKITPKEGIWGRLLAERGQIYFGWLCWPLSWTATCTIPVLQSLSVDFATIIFMQNPSWSPADWCWQSFASCTKDFPAILLLRIPQMFGIPKAECVVGWSLVLS